MTNKIDNPANDDIDNHVGMGKLTHVHLDRLALTIFFPSKMVFGNKKS